MTLKKLVISPKPLPSFQSLASDKENLGTRLDFSHQRTDFAFIFECIFHHFELFIMFQRFLQSLYHCLLHLFVSFWSSWLLGSNSHTFLISWFVHFGGQNPCATFSQTFLLSLATCSTFCLPAQLLTILYVAVFPTIVHLSPFSELLWLAVLLIYLQGRKGQVSGTWSTKEEMIAVSLKAPLRSTRNSTKSITHSRYNMCMLVSCTSCLCV